MGESRIVEGGWCILWLAEDTGYISFLEGLEMVILEVGLIWLMRWVEVVEYCDLTERVSSD